MTLRIDGVPQLQARLRALKGSGKNITGGWALSTLAEYKRGFRPHTKTGTTVRSARVVRVTPTQGTVAAGFGAPYVEGGTRPHLIVPRRAKALRFAPKGQGRLTGAPRKGGAVIFAKRVHHPGSKADPVMHRAASLALRLIGVKPVVDAWNKGA